MSSASGFIVQRILAALEVDTSTEMHGIVGVTGKAVNSTALRWEVLKAKKNPCCLPGFVLVLKAAYCIFMWLSL